MQTFIPLKISYFKAYSLIESLITIALIAIVVSFATPKLFEQGDQLKLDREMSLISSFIVKIQDKARFERKRYSMLINQKDEKWCMVAINKPTSRKVSCNCLEPNSCNKFKEYYILENSIKSEIKTRLLYPKTFLNIDGIAFALESKCIKVSVNDAHDVLFFNQYGVINVLPKSKRSNCR